MSIGTAIEYNFNSNRLYKRVVGARTALGNTSFIANTNRARLKYTHFVEWHLIHATIIDIRGLHKKSHNFGFIDCIDVVATAAEEMMELKKNITVE